MVIVGMDERDADALIEIFQDTTLPPERWIVVGPDEKRLTMLVDQWIGRAEVTAVLAEAEMRPAFLARSVAAILAAEGIDPIDVVWFVGCGMPLVDAERVLRVEPHSMHTVAERLNQLLAS